MTAEEIKKFEQHIEKLKEDNNFKWECKDYREIVINDTPIDGIVGYEILKILTTEFSTSKNELFRLVNILKKISPVLYKYDISDILMILDYMILLMPYVFV